MYIFRKEKDFVKKLMCIHTYNSNVQADKIFFCNLLMCLPVYPQGLEWLSHTEPLYSLWTAPGHCSTDTEDKNNNSQTPVITNKLVIICTIYSRHGSKFEFYNFRHEMELECCTSLSDRTHWRKPVPSLRTMNIRFFPIDGNKMHAFTCQAQNNILNLYLSLNSVISPDLVNNFPRETD